MTMLTQSISCLNGSCSKATPWSARMRLYDSATSRIWPMLKSAFIFTLFFCLKALISSSKTSRSMPLAIPQLCKKRR